MMTPTKMEMNRTGIQTSPVDAKKMEQGAEQLTPVEGMPQDGAGIRTRMLFAKQAEPIGTVPPPVSMKGAAKTALQALKGNKPNVFLDYLGARLAFERTGTRLYDAILIKFESEGGWDGGPTAEELRQIREEELQHFEMLKECMQDLGADPTAMTPAADVAAVAAEGVMKVVVDSRMSLAQSMEGILIAELADHDGWDMLVALADSMGKTDFSERFRQALAEEDRHLMLVRGWLSRRIEAEATRTLEPVQPVS